MSGHDAEEDSAQGQQQYAMGNCDRLVIEGTQPDGTMSVRKSNPSLPGFKDCGTIVIDYYIPSGKQTERHPNPGQRYDGTSRTAYLPDNKEGKEVLSLLQKAFDQKLIFTVGTSTTTGRENQVTWSDIPHKTSMTGGPQSFGYPDPDYLGRVRDVLKAIFDRETSIGNNKQLQGQQQYAMGNFGPLVIEGTQPDGTMSVHTNDLSLPGFKDCGTIVIDYYIPSGNQTERHPNPGQRYDGASRTAYLPDNKEGKEVLRLLKKAFDQKLIFSIGTSTTTGRENQVTWSDIPHKTSMTGGPQRFGYPDPDYLGRIRDVLKAKGIE